MADKSPKQKSSLLPFWKKSGDEETLPGNMRVLTIAHTLPEEGTIGSGRLAYALYRQLGQEADVESFLLATTDSSRQKAHSETPFLSYGGDANVFLFHNDYFDPLFQSHRRPEQLCRHFVPFLREMMPDVVHFHHTSRLGVEAIRLVRDILPDTRIIYTLQEYLPVQQARQEDAGRYKLCEHFIKTHFDLVDALVFPREPLAKAYISWGLPEKKCHIISNGIEPAKPASYRPLARNEKRQRFVCFDDAGAEMLADAMRLLERREEGQAVTSLYAKLPEGNMQLDTQVRYHTPCRAEDMAKAITPADWVVVTAFEWERTPAIIAEAFRHRRPVIYPDVPGISSLIADGSTGLHFYSGNASSLADAMSRAMNEKGLWDQLVANAPSPYTLQECAGDYLNLYRSEDKQTSSQSA